MFVCADDKPTITGLRYFPSSAETVEAVLPAVN